ncbi:hypothetical protein BC937DRAFT_94541 [Endogone sp. FLAS-F59071]|nr:hypothetical protein BC937DRAFT_94541 [Endogone sp. FLAS-F59071]|eukprot:RUS13957.1 hypothetical protein BC937DRAFT_94541 [Endogone sp. FLAS-F59071]
MSTQREIQVWEAQYDAQELISNGWNFQIAKSVANAAGDTTYNVVWQSKAIAPNTYISWQTVYALNFTANVPAAGVTVTVTGDWQACAIGQSYDLDENGFWQTSTSSGDPNFMNVGKVNYEYPDTDGIHIVVGVKNSNGSFDIIFIDETALPPGSTAKYQPQEKVKLWYQAGIQTSTIISSETTNNDEIDFSKPAPETNQFYYSATFIYNTGTWVISPYSPASTLYAPPTRKLTSVASNYNRLWPSVYKILYGIPIEGAKTVTASLHLKKLLEIKYKDVSVTVINEINWKVIIGGVKHARPYSVDAVGANADNTKADISASLTLELAEGYLPPKETWNIGDGSEF